MIQALASLLILLYAWLIYGAAQAIAELLASPD